MSAYRRRLEADLARWTELGLVGRRAAEAILADADAREALRPEIRLWDVLAVLAAVLMILAAAAFVAANWQVIPRPWRLGVLIGSLWAAHAAAAAFAARGAVMAAHAALLFGAGLFGATVMLVGQMYHLAGDPSGAVLIWAAGALFSGALMRSPPTLMLAAGLTLLWAEWSVWWRGDAQWLFIPMAALLAAGFLRAGWRGGRHVMALAIGYWIVATGFRVEIAALELEHAQPVVAAIGAAVCGIGLAGAASGAWRARLDAVGPRFSQALAVYGFLVAYAGLLFTQVLADEAPFAVLAAVALAGLVLGLWIAVERDVGALVWWLYAALAVQLSLIYARTIGTLLGASAFFLIAAALVVGLAWLAHRLHSRRTRAAAQMEDA